MSDEATVTIEISDGAAAAATADAALRTRAGRAAGTPAFTDSPDRERRGLGPVRSVTFAEADALATRIAARLSDAGLRPGEVMTIQAPNVVEAPLLILGAWRAGLVACIMPLFWRCGEISRAFAQVAPKAAVAVTRYGDEHPAQAACDAAAGHESIARVFAFGADAPGGAAPIDDWFAPPEEAEGEEESGADQSASRLDRPAVITWSVTPSGPCPVARTHRQVTALARMFAASFKLGNADVTLNPYPYTSIAAVAGQLAAPLMAGAGTVLHLPFDFEVFLQQLESTEISCATVPAPVIAALEEKRDLRRSSKIFLKRLGCVWPNPHGIASAPGLFEPSLPIVDIHSFGELAVLAHERAKGTDPALLPLGKMFSPDETDDDADEPLVETRVRGSVAAGANEQLLTGTLVVRGSTVPKGTYVPENGASGMEPALHADANGFIDTGIGCVVGDRVPGQFRCKKSEDVIYHGGALVAASELDSLYAGFPEFLDAAAFALEDAVMGERIFAAVVPRPELSPSLGRLKAYLAEKRVAAFKTPDQLVIVRSIPRRSDGAVLRDQILAQV